MNKQAPIRTARSVCPHDCPSTCALDVEILDDTTIGRVRGAKDDPYTAGVICEKVARYAERIHNPDRLLHPMRRTGAKGAGEWQRLTWDEAIDEIATRFLDIERRHGAEAIWPYFYAGTMGHVQRDSINRLRNAKAYSRQYETICTGLAWPGYVAGTGILSGVPPEEMTDAGCVVIWGTNPVHTQVNVMTHAMRAKRNGARIVVVDIYRTATMQQADLGLVLRPGSDGALACAVMHILLRDGLADRGYMAGFTDFSPRFETHLKSRTPQWAAGITGLSVDEIEAFAHLVGETKATYFRLGYGFSRQFNGTTNMHAVLCLPAMTGAWQHRGGGALHTNSGIWGLDKTDIEGQETATRRIDMCEIGAALNGDRTALRGGGPVMALLIQNTNPAVVAPEQELVRKGLMREDLFTVVHEQVMTETAELADIVLPATMFLEHNDYYTRGGETRILYGPKLVEAPGEARSNLFVISELAKRLDVPDPALFEGTDNELIDAVMQRSGLAAGTALRQAFHIDRKRAFDKAHFLDGFAWPDGRFRFAPDWQATRLKKDAIFSEGASDMPEFADWWDVNERTDRAHPFKLATSPSRGYLNTSFNETPGSRKREGTPRLLIRPDDAAALDIADGDQVAVGNFRGEVSLKARFFDGMQQGVVIAEGLHPNKAHKTGKGINTLTSARPAAPFGGAAFHDIAVWVKKA